MEYNVYYDVCAIAILIIIYIATIRYKRFPTFRSRSFQLLVGVVLVGDILNLVCALASAYLSNKWRPLEVTLSAFHLFIFDIIPIFYLMFIHSMTLNNLHLPRAFFVIIACFIALVFIAAVISPLTHFLMFFDEDGTYKQGIGLVIMYANAIGFLICSAVDVIVHWRRIGRGQALVTLFYIVSSIAACIYQSFHPLDMVLGFVAALTVFIAFLTMQNTSSFINSSMGTFNLDAFKEVLIGSTRIERCSLIIFKMTKTNKLRDLFGIEGRYFITRQFMSSISRVCDRAQIFYLFNDTYLIIFKKKASRLYECRKP